MHVLLAGTESADQQRANSLLQTLAVVPGVSVHCLPGAQQEKYLQALQSRLQSELSVPPLILMPLQASAVYAPLLTALNSGAVAESSQSRAFASPRGQKMNAPALCVLGSAEGDSSAHAPGALLVPPGLSVRVRAATVRASVTARRVTRRLRYSPPRVSTRCIL